MPSITHDPLRELSELRNQLSYAKRLGFLFGAGTSKAMGIPDILTLTKEIESSLGEKKASFISIKSSLKESSQQVEGVLNKIRLIRELTNDDDKKTFDGLTGKDAKELDKSICNAIYNIISNAESHANISPARSFVAWLNWASRDYTKEIFTTNYDLILEKSFEHLLIPFYDGFIGSHEPFFAHESLDGNSKYDRPPVSWIRLWKLHGSLGWFWKLSNENVRRVVRLSAGAKEQNPESELVIYPSRDKYESSRKQPFIGYFDRLKEFLLQGEGIFIITGYSFSDDHINEIIFNGLNQNNRLHVLAFFYTDDPIHRIVSENKNLPNITMMGPKYASISGVNGEWGIPKSDTWISPFCSGDKITLGDFNALVRFLTVCSGRVEGERKTP